MRNWSLGLALVGAVLGVAGLPSRGLAWGKEGHPIVGKVADNFLTPRARKAIDELLQNHQYKSIADSRLPNWADAIRGSAMYRQKYPKMASWHFIDIDIRADLNNLNLADFCNDDNCVLAALQRFKAVLKDTSKTAEERREALFFIVHFVGDLHQPLHCAERDNDRGGNLLHVRLPGDDAHTTNLHKVWDTELVLEAMGDCSLDDYAKRLSNTIGADRRKEFQQGTVEQWIVETHKLARTKAYRDRNAEIKEKTPAHMLSSSYIADNAEVVEEQLTRAGLRLAKFLNDTLKE